MINFGSVRHRAPIGVINDGRIVLVEDKSVLMKKLGKKELRIDLHVPLTEIPAENRQWEALSQVDIQTELQVMTAPEQHFEAFILASANDPEARNRRKAFMRERAIQFTHPGLSVLRR